MILNYKQAYSYICEIINNQSGTYVIAIDGRSASGKTTFADSLNRQVIHTDDFYRPRNESGRLAISEFDGNFDISRFKREIVEGIKSNLPFCYGVFNCAEGLITERRRIELPNCIIVEGAYSLNPNLYDYADLKVFFDIDKETQKERIIKRNGVCGYERFKQIWIPAEERYFKHYGIKEKCDIIITAEV